MQKGNPFWMQWMRRKEGSKTFESNFFSLCFYNYSGDEENTKIEGIL